MKKPISKEFFVICWSRTVVDLIKCLDCRGNEIVKEYAKIREIASVYSESNKYITPDVEKGEYSYGRFALGKRDVLKDAGLI